MAKLSQQDNGEVPEIDMDVDGTPFFKRPVCCHDLFFLILFVVFLGGLFTMWGIAGQRGDIRRLTYPMDYGGNLCGFDNGEGKDFTNKRYLAWYDADDWESQICVAACRSNAEELGADIDMDEFETSEIYDPKADVTATYPRYDDIAILRRCQPKNLENVPAHFRSMLGDEGSTAIFADIENAWWVFLVMVIIAIVLCVLYIFLLRMFALELLWFTVVASIIMIFSFGVVLLAAATDKLPNQYLDDDSILSRELSENEKNMSLGVGIVLILLTLVLIILVAWLRKSISLVGRMIEEAGLIVMDVPSILFFPILPLLVAVGWFTLWMYFTMLIASTNTMDTSVPVEFSAGSRVSDMDQLTQFCMAYNVFGFIWVCLIIFAVTRTTIAGVGSAWYFTRDKDNIEGKSDQLSGTLVMATLGRTLRYNLGSMALGALILTIAYIIRFICNVLTSIINKDSKNQCMIWWSNCISCCVNTIVKCIEYVTKYAYIEVAMYGIDFFKAASRSGHLISKNLMKIGVVDTVGDLMLFLCKMAVTFLSGFICKAILATSHFEELANPKSLTLMVMVLVYLIASSFFSVVETTIDTILVCFCEDVESNDPEKGRPYYMREEFKQFIDEQENLMHPKEGESS